MYADFPVLLLLLFEFLHIMVLYYYVSRYYVLVGKYLLYYNMSTYIKAARIQS